MVAHEQDVVIELCLLVLFVSCANSVDLKCRNSSLTYNFYGFAVKYKKQYLNNVTEFQTRCDVYDNNRRHSDQLNQRYGSGNGVYGVNKFADLTSNEFEALYLSNYTPQPHRQNGLGQSKPARKERLSWVIPQKVDWRSSHAVTQVMDQKTCGACWAFSIVETMESMYAIQENSSAPHLSVQQLIDCDDKNMGCEGGDICDASIWASRNGVVPNVKYPLTDHTDACKKSPVSVPRMFVNTYHCAGYKNDEKQLLHLLSSQGPIAVAIGAKSWHNYVRGILQYHCDPIINHAVQIVGYDLTGPVPYYIVRNSWGSDFGDQGYLYIKYGDNLCGLTAEVASLHVKV